MRRPRIRIKLWMVLVAAAVPAIVLGWYVDARKREEHRRTLQLFGSTGSRSHFRSADDWRGYLEECRQAEAYLGITPRRFEKGAGLWTDDDERRYWEDRRRIGIEVEEVLKARERLAPNDTPASDDRGS